MKNLIPLTLCLIFLGCDSSKVYDEYMNLNEAFWHKDSIQSFQFEIEDNSQAYDLVATFRNASSYPFYNLYFQYTLTDSLNNVLSQELKEINFFDPKTGEPLGSGLGDLFDHSLILEEGYSFETAGFYSIQLQQFMRMDTLPFIMSVGARVELSEE